MSLGINIALGIGSALVFRMVSNAAFQSTMPQVDPGMPSAGPVLVSMGLPGIGAGLAYAYKYNKVASVLAGVALGGGISTAEYMAYARGAQSPAAMPSGTTYTWYAIHRDGTRSTIASGQFDVAELAKQDNTIVNANANDPDIAIIARQDAAGNIAVLANKIQPLPTPSVAVGELGPSQSGVIVRMRRM